MQEEANKINPHHSTTFYLYRSSSYNYSLGLYDMITNRKSRQTNILALKGIVSEMGQAFHVVHPRLAKFFHYCLQDNKSGQAWHKISPLLWRSIARDCYKQTNMILKNLRRSPYWARRSTILSLVFDQAPTNRLPFKVQFPHCRKEYQIQIPLGHVAVTKILNALYYAFSKFYTMKMCNLVSWKVWMELWWLCMFGENFCKRLKTILQDQVDTLKKYQA